MENPLPVNDFNTDEEGKYKMTLEGNEYMIRVENSDNSYSVKISLNTVISNLNFIIN
jgi:hypothetical protein